MVNFLDGSFVIVDRSHMREFFNAPEYQLSFEAAIKESLQFEFTQLRYQDINIPVIRSQLTQHIPVLFNSVLAELNQAVGDEFPVTEGKVRPIFIDERLDFLCGVQEGRENYSKNNKPSVCRSFFM